MSNKQRKMINNISYINVIDKKNISYKEFNSKINKIKRNTQDIHTNVMTDLNLNDKVHTTTTNNNNKEHMLQRSFVILTKELLCQYKSRHCINFRTVKKNGNLHSLCEYHRNKANSSQRRLDQKRKRMRSLSFNCNNNHSITIPDHSINNNKINGNDIYLKNTQLQCLPRAASFSNIKEYLHDHDTNCTIKRETMQNNTEMYDLINYNGTFINTGNFISSETRGDIVNNNNNQNMEYSYDNEDKYNKDILKSYYIYNNNNNTSFYCTGNEYSGLCYADYEPIPIHNKSYNYKYGMGLESFNRMENISLDDWNFFFNCLNGSNSNTNE